MSITNKLVLGTAQLGLSYGINNKAGQPSEDMAFNILKQAVSSGIRSFDTASLYGEAEELLGKFFSTQNATSEIAIISKFGGAQLPNSERSVYQLIRTQILKSLERLRVNALQGYLLHSAQDIYNPHALLALARCKQENLIKNFGLSIYQMEDGLHAVKECQIDYLQIPFNILDQRAEQSNLITLAKKNNITIFARSIYLQGLILMPEDEIPSNLGHAKKYLQTFDEIIKDYQLTRNEAALHFVLQNKNIDFIVFGVDNESQLSQYIEIAKRKFELSDLQERLNTSFQQVDSYTISPNLWNIKER